MDNIERRFFLDIAQELKEAVGVAPGRHLGKRERKVAAIAAKMEEAVR